MFDPENPPEISAQRWLNADTKISLKQFRGKVVVVVIFQIACPGSVKYGLPQAQRLRATFNEDEVALFGLHMAFEKHEEQSIEAVEKFLADNHIQFPVAYDKPAAGGVPETMQAYELAGTPALLIFDRQGRVRRHYLGLTDDLRLGAEIMALLMEERNAPRELSMAIESKLATALVDPDEHEHGPNCGHDHSPAHGEGHVHGPGCNHD